MRNVYLKITALIFMVFLITACQTEKEDITEYVRDIANETVITNNEYGLRVFMVHGEEGVGSQSAYDHFEQSVLPNLEVENVSISDLVNRSFDQVDLIYLDTNIDFNHFEQQKDQLISFVNTGGNLFLPHQYADAFPTDFLGVESWQNVTTKELNFFYPAVGENISGLQKAWESFATIYSTYDGLNPEYHINFEKAAVLSTAQPLVEQDGLAYLFANNSGDGMVIWSNQFLPNEQFITRFDFQSEEDQKYFHYGYASANYFFRNELLSSISKDKFGFALKKGYGPYGRPGIAWQNHYEASYSFFQKDMIKWIDLLEEHQQIPSYSVVRGSYDWGQWHAAMAIHENIGSNANPIFEGESANSFYSSGVRLEGTDGHLMFGRHPGYLTLLSYVEFPYRAYPQSIDWNNNGLADLIVGAYDGKLYLVENKGTKEQPVFEEKKELNISVSDYAAPVFVDLNSNGQLDLLVGDGEGAVTVFQNEGSNTFKKQGALLVDGSPLKVGGVAAPTVGDWNGNGVVDLLVGDELGHVYLYKGLKDATGNISFSGKEQLRTSEGPMEVLGFAAPHIVDWNEDGKLQLLVGEANGEISIFSKETNSLVRYLGQVEGQTKNFFGTHSLNHGRNAVPLVVDWNNNGKKDLLTGFLEYGIPYAIDEKFPHPERFQENVQYAMKKHIPLVPHMYFHEYLNEEQEKREIALHKQAFHNLGLPWDDDMGVDHHTWRINKVDPVRTFMNQKESGIWWNFGYNPPNVGSAPRDGVEFLMLVPFLLPTEDGEPFVLYTSAPNALNNQEAWFQLSKFDTPMPYFEHIEFSMDKGTDINNKLLNKISFMNQFRDDYNYSFMLQEQIARSLLNTFYAEVNVKIDGPSLTITPDYSNVPWQVKEYIDTLGVKIELGEKYLGQQVNSNGLFYYEGNDGFYLGLNETLTVTIEDENHMNDNIFIERANGPVEIVKEEKGIKLLLKTRGMQEVRLYSPVPLHISGGENLTVKQSGDYYNIYHYGDVAELTVTGK